MSRLEQSDCSCPGHQGGKSDSGPGGLRACPCVCCLVRVVAQPMLDPAVVPRLVALLQGPEQPAQVRGAAWEAHRVSPGCGSLSCMHQGSAAQLCAHVRAVTGVWFQVLVDALDAAYNISNWAASHQRTFFAGGGVQAALRYLSHSDAKVGHSPTTIHVHTCTSPAQRQHVLLSQVATRPGRDTLALTLPLHPSPLHHPPPPHINPQVRLAAVEATAVFSERTVFGSAAMKAGAVNQLVQVRARVCGRRGCQPPPLAPAPGPCPCLRF